MCKLTIMQQHPTANAIDLCRAEQPQVLGLHSVMCYSVLSTESSQGSTRVTDSGSPANRWNLRGNSSALLLNSCGGVNIPPIHSNQTAAPFVAGCQEALSASQGSPQARELPGFGDPESAPAHLCTGSEQMEVALEGAHPRCGKMVASWEMAYAQICPPVHPLQGADIWYYEQCIEWS